MFGEIAPADRASEGNGRGPSACRDLDAVLTSPILVNMPVLFGALNDSMILFALYPCPSSFATSSARVRSEIRFTMPNAKHPPLSVCRVAPVRPAERAGNIMFAEFAATQNDQLIV